MGISPNYFLDEMSQSEIGALYTAEVEKEKISWDQTRLQCFYTVVAQTGGKSIKKPTDLFKFPWDNEEVKKPKAVAKPLTPEEFNELIKQVNIIQDGRQ